MPRSSLRLRQSARVLRHWVARPHVLFGGVYGAVLASSMVAALTEQGATARPPTGSAARSGLCSRPSPPPWRTATPI